MTTVGHEYFHLPAGAHPHCDLPSCDTIANLEPDDKSMVQKDAGSAGSVYRVCSGEGAQRGQGQLGERSERN